MHVLNRENTTGVERWYVYHIVYFFYLTQLDQRQVSLLASPWTYAFLDPLTFTSSTSVEDNK